MAGRHLDAIQRRSKREFGQARRSKVTGLRATLVYFAVAGISSVGLAQDKHPGQAQQAEPVTGQGSSSPSGDKPSQKRAPEVAAEPVKSAVYDPAQYVIGADDELMIAVWREPELSLGVVVRPDGIITLPLVNEVRAAGLKPLELQSLLTDKLKPFVNEPQVTVVVRAIRSRKVYLTGPGVKAGVFAINGRMTAVELLVQGGGLGPFAKAKSIYILRMVNGRQTRIHFNYKEAISGKSGGDVLLEPGDVVVVP
jgi:polysaccharide export outer membrane protein